MQNHRLSPELENSARILDKFTRERLQSAQSTDYSVSRALRALHGRHWPGFPMQNVPAWENSLEHDEHQKLKRQYEALGVTVGEGDLLVPTRQFFRSLSTSPGSKGGFLVGSDIIGYDHMLRQRSVAFRLGIQRVTVGQANLTWVKQLTASTATWLTPGGTVPSSAGTFTQTSASPHSLIAFCEIPFSLWKQADDVGDGFILDGPAKDLLTAVDLAVLAGSGADGQPLGIVNTTGIGSFSGASINYANVLQPQIDVTSANAVLDPDTMGYVTNPGGAAILKARQRFTSTDSPLWKGSIHEGEIEGVRALSTKQLSAGLLFGDFSTVNLIEWGGIALRINPYQDYSRGFVGVRAMWMVDVLVRYPASFSFASALT